ncbi:MAG: CotH kinase family protein [Erysipelotrichaceae bacterium]|nr:CotH kinase family protein [Erysipelotrichaceae bacterium]
MNKKNLGTVVCLLGITSTVLLQATLYKRPNSHYTQHLESPELSPVETTSFSSHLPIISITTDESIPGAYINGENYKDGYVTTESGLDITTGTYNIYSSDIHYNSLLDTPTESGNLNIKIRGNSSRAFLKKSYEFNCLDEEGNEIDISVLGLPAGHQYVLYGPYVDETYMRNYMWYNLAGQIMDYAPTCKYVELFNNGEYDGLYLLLTPISVSEERIDISVKKKRSSYSGYILRLDRPEKEYTIDNFTHYTYIYANQIGIIYPRAKLTPEIEKKITDDYNRFEKTLHSYDYKSEDFGYEKYIDVASFVDYFIINELSGNNDSGQFSTYVYKDKSGKYKMAVWDFNICANNADISSDEVSGFDLVNDYLFLYLMKDEEFNKRIINRYKALREDLLSEENLLKYVDETSSFLGEAIDRNRERWPEINVPKTPVWEINSYEDAIDQYKDYLIRRGRWMDENIDTLLQYSADSSNKKYNEVSE